MLWQIFHSKRQNMSSLCIFINIFISIIQYSILFFYFERGEIVPHKLQYYADDLIEQKIVLIISFLELNFPGIEVTEAHVQSERGEGANNLYTYMDTTTVRLQSVDLS